MDRGIFDLAMYQTLKMGGNTDQNCAAVGGILGALVGFKHLPRDKVSSLLACDPS